MTCSKFSRNATAGAPRSNAICEPWSNGETEGQINRLEILKRTMYGRASVALFRARKCPLRAIEDHQM
jgi:hypothetical protein